MICPNLKTCPFINNKNESNIDNYKRKFCNKDYLKCARYKASMTLDKVPEDMKPDDYEKLRMKNEGDALGKK